MEFFSPWMLLGLAAVAVPVLIHLFNRKSAKTVNWGAFIFLLDSMVSRRRRMLIEEMLLLATRCLLLALLALALARPFIQAASRVPWVVVLPMMLLAVTFFGVSFAMWRYPKWRRGLFALSVLLAAIAGGVVLLEHRLNLSRFGAGLQRDVVLVIDGSSSMTMRQGAESNFDRARTEAEAYIKGADRGTAFGILVGGPVAQVVMPAPSADRRELFSILDGLQPVQGTMDIMNTLSAAAVMLASGNNPSKQIVIVGDGQAAGWHLTAPERWRAAREVLRGSGVQGSRDPGVKGSRGQGVQETATVDGNRMQSNAIETLTPNPLNPLTPIVWRTLPLPPSVRNVGIADISLSREIVGTDREVGIRVTLANTGSEAVTPEAVVLEIRGQGVKGSRDSGSAALDGNRMQSNAIETLTPNPLNPLTPSLILTNRTVRQLEPGTSHTVTFQHQFTQAGAQPIRARVIANDDLPADDAMTHVVQVVEALRVLIVDGNPVPRPLDRASAYLALALRPEVQKSRNPEVENSPLLDSSTSELRDFLIDPEVVDLPAVARREGFTDCAAVILADVGALPEQAAERLARFVASGGGLLIAPGARAQTNFYNAWALDGERVTPLPLQAFALSPETNRPSLKPASFTYDALSSFRTGSDLASVSAMRHWRMGEGESRSIEVEKLKNGEVATSKLLDSSTSQLLNFSHVVASFDNDDPFLAVRRFGRGTVMLSAIPFDATVSALPSRGSFLPLVHEIVCHLANPSTADLNLLPREGATLHLAGGGMARNDPTAQGLQGVYYSGTDFTGRAFGRVDGAIDFSFDRTPPVARLDSDRFSVRWTGSLTSRHSEEHEIWLETNARATLRVNGRTAENRRYTLRAGQPNTILIEMAKTEDWANVRLFWRGSRQQHEVVPKARLSPYRALQINEPVDVVRLDGSRQQSTAIDGNRMQSNTIETLTPNPLNPLTPHSAHYIQTSEGLALRVSGSLQPGYYTAGVPEPLRDELRNLTDASGRVPFNVRAGIGESDLAAVTRQDIAFLRNYVDLQVAQKAEEVHKALVGETFGKEIWRILAYAALFFLVLEIALTRWIAIQRRTGVEETVTFEDTSASATDAFRQELEMMRGGAR